MAVLELPLPDKLFLNNAFVTSSNPKTLSVYNPADGSLVSSSVPLAGQEDVDKAVDFSTNAFYNGEWRDATPATRRGVLLRFAALLRRNTRQLSKLTQVTMGMPYEAFGEFEVGLAADLFEYYAGWIDKYAGESYPAEDGFYKIVRHEPLGVCAGIIPWNTPLASVALKAAPALAMGNTFILKTSEKAPFAGLALGDLIREAGFPPGVFQLLSGDGSTGALLASHGKIKKVSFTGSVATGKLVQKAAASSNLKRVTLELGGKSPAVVFNDANLKNAVSWCVNALVANTGQLCFATTRVYVQEGIYEQFLSEYKAGIEAKTAKIGDPALSETEVGPLADQPQFNRVLGFIERARSNNQGTVLTGGKRIGNQGFFVEPTVFTNVTDDAEIYKQEIFGPVSVVKTFKTEEEIIEKSNDSNFGLQASVFTQDISRALRVSSKLDAGVVGVNCASLTSNMCPFGGTKESGIGREMGHFALRAYTEPKTVLINMAS